MEKKPGCFIAARLMSKLFGVGGDGSNGTAVVREGRNRTLSVGSDGQGEEDFGTGGNEVDEEESSDDDEDGPGSNGNKRTTAFRKILENQWIYVKVPDAFQCTEVFEALLENIMFFLGEPVTIGFFTFFTHYGDDANDVDGQQHANFACSFKDSDIESSLTHTGSGPQEPRGAELIPSIDDAELWDEWSKTYCSTLAETSADGSNRLECDVKHRKVVIDMLTKETEKLHRDTSTVLRVFATSVHDRINIADFPCKPCCKKLD